jgi:hypothetical protein
MNAAPPNHVFRQLLYSDMQSLRIRIGVELKAQKTNLFHLSFLSYKNSSNESDDILFLLPMLEVAYRLQSKLRQVLKA